MTKQGDINKYYESEEWVKQALAIGQKEVVWESIYDNLEQTLSDDYKVMFPTGINQIDEFLGGGFYKQELVLIAASSGIGKAQPLNEVLLTPRGFKKMGDIQVGDYVIGSNSKPIQVEGVFPQGLRDVYRVTFSDGTYADCDYEHLWNVKTVDDRLFRTLSLKEIYESAGNFSKYKIPSISSPVEFEKADLNIDPYVMGYFLGNGTYHSPEPIDQDMKVTVNIEHYKEVMEVFRKHSDGSFEDEFRPKKNGYNIYLPKSYKTLFGNHYDLEKKELKQENRFIPTDYIFNTIQNRTLLLNGLLDANGVVDENGDISFSTPSKRMSEDIKTLVMTLGGFVNITQEKSNTPTIGLIYKVSVKLCNKSITFCKIKKKQRVINYNVPQDNEKYIKSIGRVGKQECQCIKVSADDELYVTRDMILTHNTTISTSFAANFATHKCKDNNYTGYKVAQIFFEDRAVSIKRKHFGKITGVEARNLSKAEYIDYVRSSVETYEDKELIKDNLRIGRFRTGENTPQQLTQYIKKLINSGFKPDAILIDYFECVKNPKTDYGDQWSGEASKMREFETWTWDFDCLVMVTTQGTKDSTDGLFTMNKTGGAKQKFEIAHSVLTISKTSKDKEDNRATLYFPKRREGESEKSWSGCEFNNGTCIINAESSVEFGNIEQLEEKQKEDMSKVTNDILKREFAKKNSSMGAVPF